MPPRDRILIGALPSYSYPGIQVLEEIPDAEEFGHSVFALNYAAALGLMARVKSFRLQSSGNIFVDGGLFEGPIDLTLTARIFFNEGEATPFLDDERALCAMVGWYGSQESSPDWTLSEPGEEPVNYDPGRCRMRLWNKIAYLNEGLCVMLKPELFFNPLSDFYPEPTGFVFGPGPNELTVHTYLPDTRGGTFDGYNEDLVHNLTIVKQGIPAASMEGTLNLTATEFWPYADEDGANPIYDAATGEWLLDPVTGGPL